MSSPCIFCRESLVAFGALKFLRTNWVLGRNVRGKLVSERFFANWTFVRVVNFEFGGIVAPSRAQFVPRRFVLRGVRPDSTVEFG